MRWFAWSIGCRTRSSGGDLRYHVVERALNAKLRIRGFYSEDRAYVYLEDGLEQGDREEGKLRGNWME